MIHHKAFPYAFFCMAFVLAIPTIWWTLAESDVVKVDPLRLFAHIKFYKTFLRDKLHIS